MKRIKPHLILLLCILILGGILRWAGMTHDMTDDGRMAGYWHPNEDGLIRHSLETFRPPLLDHQYWGYPSLHMYLLASLDLLYYGVNTLISIRIQDLYPTNLKKLWQDPKSSFFLKTAKQFYLDHEKSFYLLARIVSWVAGMATLFLLYRMGTQVLDIRAALAAALFLACYQQHVEQCHYGTVDTLFTFLCLLAVSSCYRAFVTASRKDFLLAGLFVGLATAEKYNAFILGFTLLLAFFLARDREGRHPPVRNLFASLAVCVGVFFLVNFYIFIDPEVVIGLFKRNLQIVAYGETTPVDLATGIQENYWALKSFGLGPVFLLSIPGALLFLVKNLRGGIVLLSFPITFFFLMSSFHLRCPYYLLPMIPIIMLLAAQGLLQLSGWLLPKKVHRIVFPLLAVYVAWISLQETTSFLSALRNMDTRQIATEWIYQNLPKGSKLVVEGNEQFGPSLSEEDFVMHNRTASTHYRWNSLAKCRRGGIEYFIASEEMKNNVAMGWIPPSGIYQELTEDPDVELLKTFKEFHYEQTFLNPTIWLYRIHPPKKASGTRPRGEGSLVSHPDASPASEPLPSIKSTDLNGPMIYIPDGTFLMGTDPDDPIREPSQKDLQPVHVPAFWIDKYPFPNQRGEFPKTNIDWFEARTLCTSLGKRLCTEEEWEKACKGPDNHRYPYGDSFQEGTCFVTGNYMDDWYQPMGRYSSCVSGYGVAEMSGNINEWTGSSWTREDVRTYGTRVNKMPLGWAKKSHTYLPILKGGDWGMQDYELSCSSRNHILPPEVKTNDVGFRCCMDAEQDPGNNHATHIEDRDMIQR